MIAVSESGVLGQESGADGVLRTCTSTGNHVTWKAPAYEVALEASVYANILLSPARF